MELSSSGTPGQPFKSVASTSNQVPSMTPDHCHRSQSGMLSMSAWVFLMIFGWQGSGYGESPPIMPEKLKDVPPVLTPEAVKVNRAIPHVKPPAEYPSFGTQPSPRGIFDARMLPEPLVPIGGEPTSAENVELSKAIVSFSRRNSNESLAPLLDFIRAFPASPWNAAILSNLGSLYYYTGRFGKALEAWERAWALAKDARDPKGKAMGDHIAGELAKMNARIGRFERLEALFAEIEGRAFRGSATEKISGAKAGLWLMKNRPENAFRCGPMALSSILTRKNPSAPMPEKIFNSRSTLNGVSLSDLESLAQETGLKYRMARRTPGSSLILPAVIHWKVDHYAAVLERRGNLYHVKDPTFGADVWVTLQAMDEEASGYFLVPEGELPAGWSGVSEREGGLVFGKGNTGGSDPDATTSGDSKAGGAEGGGGDDHPDGDGDGDGVGDGSGDEDGNGPDCNGMAVYSFHTMQVSLNVMDNPVGYVPPKGPAVRFTATYNQREANQPANFTYSNLGPKWTFDWLSYVADDPMNGNADVSQYMDGGGSVTFAEFDSASQSFRPEMRTGALLTRLSSSPIVYEKKFKDGSREIFSVPDGASSFPRKVFLAKRFNVAGDSIAFTYDSLMRMVAVTDALGQVTTLAYEDTLDTFKITKVTDPFGRYASLLYDGTGRLKKITDVIGIASEFRYDAGDFMDSLITPYGATTFSYGQEGIRRWLIATDPLGMKEKLEFRHSAPGISATESVVPSGMTVSNTYLQYRNSFFWDKQAMANNITDYNYAVIYHWLHTEDVNTTGSILESKKMPLGRRVWYRYPNQTSASFISENMLGQPSQIGTVLEDGVTQLYQYSFNDFGSVTNSIDPIGRETMYLYDSNRIDLISIRRKRGSTSDRLDTTTYNTGHLPLARTDAAGMTWHYTYNASNQLISIRNPIGDSTAYQYDSLGYLVKTIGHRPEDTTAYTYDGFGRVRTVSNSDGYTVRFDYDALDRPTKISYPDSTFEQFTYARLDREKQRDRRGRWSKVFYNALRQPVAVQDPLERITNFEWCACGGMKSLIDPSGKKTSWRRDFRGRVTEKVYPDGRKDIFAYDSGHGYVKTRTDAKGQKAHFQYFKDGNLKKLSYTGVSIPTPAVEYTYDSVYNRLKTMTDTLGTTRYVYKSPGVLGALQIDTVDGPWSGDAITYAYDSLGRATERSVGGVTSAWTFDKLGRVVTETNALGSFQYRFNTPTFRLDSLLYPNGQRQISGYFGEAGDFRLEEIRNLGPGGGVLSKFNYTYDPEGQIRTWAQQADSNPANTYTFGYDSTDQLVSAVLRSSATGNPVLKSFAYAYDKSGNRISQQINDVVQKADHNALNQVIATQGGGKIRMKGGLNEAGTITIDGKPVPVAADHSFDTMVDVDSDTNLVAISATDYSSNQRSKTYRVVVPAAASMSYAYDLVGNMIGDGVRSFEWDAENRLVAINSGLLRTEFVYDGQGRRVRIVEKNNGSVTSQKSFLWVGNSISEERNASGATVAKRYFGQGVQVGGESFFYTRDHLGSVRELTDSLGGVVARYDYDPYGSRTKVSGSGEADFGYTGHYYHSPSVFHLTKYRAYSSELGRWISRDPLGELGGINLYGYVGNNVTRLIDPLGLNPALAWPICQAAMGMMGGSGGGAMASAAAGIAAGTAAGIAMASDDGNGGGGVTAGGGSGASPVPDPSRAAPSDATNSPSSLPWSGTPGTTATSYNPDGSVRQERQYGDDGFPDFDTDHNHDHGQGAPHRHPVSRPVDRSPPTHKDRQPGFPLSP